jgi:hypothetical protein
MAVRVNPHQFCAARIVKQSQIPQPVGSTASANTALIRKCRTKRALPTAMTCVLIGPSNVTHPWFPDLLPYAPPCPACIIAVTCDIFGHRRIYLHRHFTAQTAPRVIIPSNDDHAATEFRVLTDSPAHLIDEFNGGVIAVELIVRT